MNEPTPPTSTVTPLPSSPDPAVEPTPAPPERIGLSVNLAKIALGIFAACFLAGYLWGKICSPRYLLDGDAGEANLSSVLRSSGVLYSKWIAQLKPDENEQTLQLSEGIIHYACGSSHYYHDLLTAKSLTESDLDRLHPVNYVPPPPPERHLNSLTPEPDDPEDLAPDHTAEQMRLLLQLADRYAVGYLPPFRPTDYLGIPIKGVTAPEAIGVLFGHGQQYALKVAKRLPKRHLQEIESYSSSKQIFHAVTLLTSAVSGFAIGFVLAYHDDPPCEARTFKDQLADDSLWREVGRRLRVIYSFRLKRDRTSGVVTSVAASQPATLTLARLYHVFNAAGIANTVRISENLRDRLRSNSKKASPLHYLPMPATLINDLLSITSESYRDAKFIRSLNRPRNEEFFWKKSKDLKGVWQPDVHVAELQDMPTFKPALP